MNWTREQLDQWYSIDLSRLGRGTGRVGYGREFAKYVTRTEYELYRARITELLSRNLYSAGQTVLVVGCGFGYLMAMMRAAGAQAARVWGADTSAYIHLNKATQVHESYPTLAANILNIDILAAEALTLLKAAIGGNGLVDWVICENVTETIAVAQRPAWYAACEKFLARNGRVGHFIAAPNVAEDLIPAGWQTEGWTWQALSAWQTEAPTHTFINTHQSIPPLFGS